MNAIVLESERLLFKPLSTAHLSQTYVDWLNDPEINRYLENAGNYTLEKLNSFLSDVEKKQILFWGIHLKENQKHIGNIKIDPVNAKHGFGEYGILMGDKNEWGKGYATEASLRIIKYCFEELGLRKINLGVVLNNTAACNLYKKIGFETEGIYKKHAFYNGEYCDTLRMALFNPDFQYDQ
jgi:RimJ/RimL family protein N-acetyltransferase